ncbi:DUF1684 domain-containing protein [Marinoscillum sp. 108]|uniref:DUF1684 domain-containing protein n=1 Tax=Marinoscillum sp. 108 TaxID=2653151 RepID=UPI001356A4D7|nr:DUF1684 domain-containing protein [Marinoscillum sp. 108]
MNVKYLICALFLGYGLTTLAQSTYEAEIRQWQKELNEEFSDPDSSPLTAKEIKKFKGLEFYPINEAYRVEATLEILQNQQPFTIPTSSQQQKVFVKYAIARFELLGQAFEFPLYQSLQLQQSEEYKDYLFAPFTDETNGFETYGGGRYMDLRIPEGNTLMIDFNKAYNPSCAYSPNYNCPIPPRENDLTLEVKAGVKAWEDH